MGLPPIISLLTDTSPILQRGRLPAEDFPAGEGAKVSAAERVPADAVTNDAARDLFKNHRRVSLFDIVDTKAIFYL
jgi:hypothetical protein